PRNLHHAIAWFANTLSRRNWWFALTHPTLVDLIGLHATRDQRSAHRIGAAMRARQVIRVGTREIGLTHECDPARLVAPDLDRCPIDDLARLWRSSRLIEIEIDIVLPHRTGFGGGWRNCRHAAEIPFELVERRDELLVAGPVDLVHPIPFGAFKPAIVSDLRARREGGKTVAA